MQIIVFANISDVCISVDYQATWYCLLTLILLILPKNKASLIVKWGLKNDRVETELIWLRILSDLLAKFIPFRLRTSN